MGGGPEYKGSGETTDDMMQAWAKHMPELTRIMGQNILPMERAQLDAQREIAPGQAKLSYDLSNEFMPKFTKLGIDQNRQQAQGQAESDLSLMSGTGRDLARETLLTQKELDPEFFKSREQSGDALTKLFASLDSPTTGLSGAEREETTRSLARDNFSRGNADATQQSTLEAAMKMGSAGQARKQQKQNAIGQAVGSAAGAMPAFRTGIDALQLTTGRASQPNAGLGQFGGVTGVGDKTMGMGGQLLQQAGTFAGNKQNNLATKKSFIDNFSQVMGSLPSCCWTFREFTEKFPDGLPWYIRASRDAHYTPARYEGYRQFSCVMVPLMQKSRVIRKLVDLTFVDPMTRHAAWLAKLNAYGWVFHPLQKLWLGFFSLLGSRNGEPAEGLN